MSRFARGLSIPPRAMRRGRQSLTWSLVAVAILIQGGVRPSLAAHTVETVTLGVVGQVVEDQESPQVSLAVSPRVVDAGQPITLLITASSSSGGIARLFWQGLGTGIASLDAEHVIPISGSPAAVTRTVEVVIPRAGSFVFLADAEGVNGKRASAGRVTDAQAIVLVRQPPQGPTGTDQPTQDVAEAGDVPPGPPTDSGTPPAGSSTGDAVPPPASGGQPPDLGSSPADPAAGNQQAAGATDTSTPGPAGTGQASPPASVASEPTADPATSATETAGQSPTNSGAAPTGGTATDSPASGSGQTVVGAVFFSGVPVGTGSSGGGPATTPGGGAGSQGAEDEDASSGTVGDWASLSRRPSAGGDGAPPGTRQGTGDDDRWPPDRWDGAQASSQGWVQPRAGESAGGALSDDLTEGSPEEAAAAPAPTRRFRAEGSLTAPGLLALSRDALRAGDVRSGWHFASRISRALRRTRGEDGIEPARHALLEAPFIEAQALVAVGRFRRAARQLEFGLGLKRLAAEGEVLDRTLLINRAWFAVRAKDLERQIASSAHAVSLRLLRSFLQYLAGAQALAERGLHEILLEVPRDARAWAMVERLPR